VLPQTLAQFRGTERSNKKKGREKKGEGRGRKGERARLGRRALLPVVERGWTLWQVVVH